MSAEVRIGTSGWHYKHWVGPFYPPKLPSSKMLPYYFGHFDTVEINNSFYRLPPENALAGWRESAPPGFRFAVKGSRYLTHMKKLKDPEPGLERFFQRTDLMGDKLGPILFQLPPNWELDLQRFWHFLNALPQGHRYAFEFRNTTWHCSEVYAELERHNVANCAFDLAGFQSPSKSQRILDTFDYTDQGENIREFIAMLPSGSGRTESGSGAKPLRLSTCILITIKVDTQSRTL